MINNHGISHSPAIHDTPIRDDIKRDLVKHAVKHHISHEEAQDIAMQLHLLQHKMEHISNVTSEDFDTLMQDLEVVDEGDEVPTTSEAQA